ncbi:MAG TPA: NAD(P) transhydrogenase subunit alpha [Anaeromyxobacteraceae bacterium]|nr:NAD(P) transhydrogenase subunit alpha [Anaeromyxobacteraceae bacterium]
MRVGIATESAPGEHRVSLVPDSVARLVRGGIEVLVERGAGQRAFLPDGLYERAGARLVGGEDALSAELVLAVRRPAGERAARLREGATLVGLLQPATGAEFFRSLAERGVQALAMERVPRIMRAQPLDALSSQATVAGYKAVLLGAASAPRLLPMLTTAAGTIPPARVLVVGAGVAGLQAIATARRLGGVVSAFDVRPAVREQVQSLGASFVDSGVRSEGAGGYAAELAAEAQSRVLAAVAGAIADQDLVVCTAQVPGKRAPVLVTDEMIRSMKAGAVIVDLAAESGGNTAATRPGETTEVGGVQVLAPLDLASTVPLHASQLYARNLEALLKLVLADGRVRLDPADEIIGPMAVVLDRRVRLGAP